MAEVKYSNVALVATGVSNADLIMISANTSNTPTTKVVTVLTLLSNTSSPIKANTFYLLEDSTPSNSTITVIKDKLWHDSDYLYIATANNVIKRVALSAF